MKAKERKSKTIERIAQYKVVKALLAEWESMPEAIQEANHAYIMKLRAKVRQHRNYLHHRNDPQANVK